MIIFFQIIFCAVKDLLSLALSQDNRENLDSKDEKHDANIRHGLAQKEHHEPSHVPETKNYSTDVNSSAAVDNSCDAMYLEVLSSKNPLVPKEFLQSLEKKSAQLTTITLKTKTSENNETSSVQDKATRIQDKNEKTLIQPDEQLVLNDLSHSDVHVQESERIVLTNCLSERDWLDELQYLFTADLKDDLKILLTKSFSETKNPFDFVLFVLSYAEYDIFSGKNSLIYIMLAEFESWIVKQTEGKTEKELQVSGLIASQEQQDSALEIVATSKLVFFEPVRRIFKLDCSSNGFLEKHIRYLLHTGKRYKEAATFITKLNLQTHFEPKEILLPLLILDKLQLAESYVMSCPWQQRAYLSMLDKLCGMNDDELQEIVNSANIHPKPKENKLKNKILIKISERLVKKFHLNGEDFPNVYKEKNLNGLRYLLHKKYTEKNKSLKKWDNLIESAIGNNYWLQERLIEGLVEYDDVDEAVRWTNYYQLPLEVVPPAVQDALREWDDDGVLVEEENWDLGGDDYSNQDGIDSQMSLQESPQNSLLYQFPLPFDKIVFVDDEWGLAECLSKVNQKGAVLGFDAEWRPTMCRAESNDKLAIIQLATLTEVYILDMIALVQNVSFEQLQDFGRDVFSNPEVLKLGYGCESDFQVMMSSCPPFKVPLSQVKRFVDICPLSKQVLSLPQIKKKINTIREKAELKRFEMEKGLSELVMLCLGKPLDKTYQVSDWEGRPLLPEQLTYAALDAYCLLEVYSVLHAWVKESRIHVDMEPELSLSSLRSADGKKKARSARPKHPKPGALGEPMSGSARSGEPMSVRSFSVVVDTMLQGLGRQLRCCGVDVKILSTGTSHDEAVKIAREEKRILLTSGTPFYAMRSKVAEGMCMCVPAGTAKEQVAQVLRHFNVRVTPGDVFSRCQICNGNQYIKVSPDYMKAAYLIMTNGNYDVLKHLPHPLDQHSPIDFENLTLRASGIQLKLGLLHNEVWSKNIELFYVCATCGKVFWDGSHFKNVLEQFAHVLEGVQEQSQQRGRMVYNTKQGRKM